MAGENANYNICMFYGQNRINQCICKAKHSIFNAIKLKLHHNMNRRKWVWYSLHCYFSSLKEFHVIDFFVGGLVSIFICISTSFFVQYSSLYMKYGLNSLVYVILVTSYLSHSRVIIASTFYQAQFSTWHFIVIIHY